MKPLVSLIAAAVALAALPIAAQWPNYATAGAPRTPDGKVILDAPAPKAPDGHPDLSGIWDLRGTGGRGGPAGPGGPGGAKGGPPKGGPPPELPPGTPPNATFKNIGSGFKEGLPMLPWAADLVKARRAENSKDNPDAHCLPLGLMQLHMHPQPRKIIQSPGLIVMLYEAQGGVRQIFTDGRPLPKDVEPWWYGYSVGKWDGDTLVVETTGFREDVWLDIDGSPLTESGKMTERIRRLNYGTLQTDVTIEDPKVYTKPFTVRVTHRLLPDTDLIEFICSENDRSGPHLVGK
jgi:hypothetical protein